ncbi:hypothetical protein KU306_17800 (plasmid) [Haloferax larsenii]|uniref:Uncharacterized protein n=1 Tax=Haloferax larsenii TaxID=302484 RepID=A0ABY5RM52_HALLR|nr:hypothetical protein [Haloferax larsenii]ELZ80520.1 hypothetical protein C455_06601 [Haloferax larsenii JCM 13917]UVE52463.1 hypothetical protein KU306_17800 [Haloferax larsenii]
MSPTPSLAKLLPNEFVPLRRIGRYACYSLTLVALGFLGADIVFFVLDLFTGLAEDVLGYVFVVVWDDLLNLVRDVVKAFALLVALGVFLSQFETGTA